MTGTLGGTSSLGTGSFEIAQTRSQLGLGKLNEDARADFSSILARGSTVAGETPTDRARRAAQQFVAIALVQPVLKELRESDHTAAPFAPSQAEKQFRTLADAEVAQRIVRAAHFPLVDRLARDMLKKTAKAGAGAGGARVSTIEKHA